MDLGFEYEIGQHLTMRSMTFLNALDKAGGGEGDKQQCFTVIERTVQECPGGVQRHYLCRITSSLGSYRGGFSITKEAFNLNEVELMPYEAPKKPPE